LLAWQSFVNVFFNDVVLAGKASRVNDCGQSSRAGKACGQRLYEASRKGAACGQNSATCPLHQRVLLQHMQARLQIKNVNVVIILNFCRFLQ
jgi:hypothetical protein